MADIFEVWPYPPASGVTESLEWMTDVIESDDGSEQRIRSRLLPRQSFAMTVSRGDATRTNMRLSIPPDTLFGVGCWHEKQIVVGGLAAWNTVIDIDTRYADFRVGGYALIWSAVDQYEAVLISEITDFSVICAPLVYDYPAGVRVIPMRLALRSPASSRLNYLPAVGNFSSSFTCVENVEFLGEPSAQQYLGYDVLSDPFLFSLDGAVNRSADWPVLSFDPGQGDWTVAARTVFQRITTPMRVRSVSMQQAWTWRQWLHRRSGRLTPIWVPTWTQDMKVLSMTGSDITVSDVSWRDIGDTQLTKQHLAFFAMDGTFVCRKILSAKVSPVLSGTRITEEVITLDAPVPVSNLAKVSFISLQRMVSDRIDLVWERPGVFESTFSMVEVTA